MVLRNDPPLVTNNLLLSPLVGLKAAVLFSLMPSGSISAPVPPSIQNDPFSANSEIASGLMVGGSWLTSSRYEPSSTSTSPKSSSS